MRTALNSGVLLLVSVAALAQQYTISTIAGGAPPPTPSPAITAAIGSPQGIAVDASGNVYFTGHNVVLEVDTNGILTRVAGNAQGGYSGDGGPATDAQLNAPSALAVDSAGNLYIADTNNNVIRQVTPDGVIATVAGNGSLGYSGDGGPATSAALNQPNAVAVDSSGALYISDLGNSRLRTVSPAGVISTIAAVLHPLSLAVDSVGDLWIIDYHNCIYPNYCPALERISQNGVGSNTGYYFYGWNDFLEDGAVEAAVAVDASGGAYVAIQGGISKHPGGTLIAQGLGSVGGIAVDSIGNLYVAETSANRIRKIDLAGLISTIAGRGSGDYSGDGGPATSAQLSDARSVALDATGNLYIADTGNNTVRVVAKNGVIVTVAGNGNPGPSGDGGPAGYATLNQPTAVAVDPSGELYIADSASIRRISANGTITSIVTTIFKFSPGALAFDGAGNLYASNQSDNRVYEPIPSPSGTVVVVAGTAQNPVCDILANFGGPTSYCRPGTLVPLGDGGQATNARLFPTALALDAYGNLLIADAEVHLYGNLYVYDDLIRKVSPTGIITSVAGATAPGLNNPQGVAIDSAGNLYISDYGNYRIRKVSPDGTITTIAGNGTQGHSGDGGPATSAQLNAPRGIAVDASGNIYVADSDSVRLLQPLE
jgi:sugar lactone lactonase YvrE